MTQNDWLAERFEENRTRLHTIAYRMLGSLSEADDAVQESWLRLSRSDGDEIENLGGWLTTVVGRVCLNLLRARKVRREEPLEVHLPDPIIGPANATHPEQAVLLADSIGLALFVVLERLTPDERIAFILHDMFAVPFDQIAPIVGRSEMAARQLASRARRRVQGSRAIPDASLERQREVVDAFLAAWRARDLDALLEVLAPDVVRRADRGAQPVKSPILRGAQAVAEGTLEVAFLAPYARPAVVNGAAGLVGLTPDRRAVSVIGFTVTAGKIIEMDILLDPERLARLDVAGLVG